MLGVLIISIKDYILTITKNPISHPRFKALYYTFLYSRFDLHSCYFIPSFQVLNGRASSPMLLALASAILSVDEVVKIDSVR